MTPTHKATLRARIDKTKYLFFRYAEDSTPRSGTHIVKVLIGAFLLDALRSLVRKF